MLACADDCMAACGNGVPEAGEACDDGDGAPLDSASCDADCTPAECGDGYINGAAGEACDDGNDDASDACPMCQDAACGDGFVRVGVEPCDDGDRDNANACSNACELPRTVFVSSQTKQGSLVGLDGADLFCSTLAEAEMMPGAFRAWLSDAVEGPADRFDTGFTGAYKLVNGSVVASDGWADLADGTLDHAIDRTEKNLAASGLAWTNTLPTGVPASSEDCDGWMMTTGTTTVGDVSAVDMTWTNAGPGQLCAAERYLYCVEDIP